MNSWLDNAGKRLSEAIRESFRLQPLLVPFYALVLAVIVGGVLIAIIGVNPFEAYWALLRGMFGTPDRIAASFARSAPFIGSALALLFAFKAGLFNIGAQGQLLIGGLFAAWLGTWAWVGDVPRLFGIILILLAGVAAGAFWGGIPGVLRARTGAHEVITTIMLNSIALLLATWLVSSQDPVILRDTSTSVPRTKPIAPSTVLPEIVDSEPRFHVGYLILVAVCFLVAFVLKRTTYGFEVNTVGLNPTAAHYAGMGVNKVIITSMAISGGFAGLAAAGEVAGTNLSYQPGTYLNIGFDGIAIALLARTNPIAVIPAALLWGSMLSGAGLMQQEADVSIDVVRIIQSLVLLFVAADAIVRYIFRLRGETDGLGTQPAVTWGA